MFENIPGLSPQTSFEYKEEQTIGNFEGREVSIERKKTCEWVKNIFKTVTTSPLFETIFGKQLREEEINSLTNECIQILEHNSDDHRSVIRDWVIRIYRAHDIYLYESGGGTYMDNQTLENADQLLNPALLKKIQMLFPHSPVAFDLYGIALRENLPLSRIIYR